MKERGHGPKCTRKEQLQLKPRCHKGRMKRAKRRPVVSSSRLRIVTNRNGVTEEVTKSLPGIGQTLDGKAEEKGKGISRFEEIDTQEEPINEQTQSCLENLAGELRLSVAKSEEVASRHDLVCTVVIPKEHNLEKIMFFRNALCNAYNEISRYIDFHLELEGDPLREKDVMACEEGFCCCPKVCRGDINHVKLVLDKLGLGDIDAGSRTLYSSMAILRKILRELLRLKQTWINITRQISVTSGLWDNETPLQKIEEIIIVIAIMGEVKLLDDDGELKCGDPNCDNPDCWHGPGIHDWFLDSDEDEYEYEEEDEDENEKEKLPVEVKPATQKITPIVRSSSTWLARATGCTCGAWCSGPSRSQ